MARRANETGPDIASIRTTREVAGKLKALAAMQDMTGPEYLEAIITQHWDVWKESITHGAQETSTTAAAT